MTKEEQITMYMKCSKKELYEMLIEANRHLKNLPIHVVSQQRELLVKYEEWKGTFLGGNTYNIDNFLKENNSKLKL